MNPSQTSLGRRRVSLVVIIFLSITSVRGAIWIAEKSLELGTLFKDARAEEKVAKISAHPDQLHDAIEAGRRSAQASAKVVHLTGIAATKLSLLILLFASLAFFSMREKIILSRVAIPAAMLALLSGVVWSSGCRLKGQVARDVPVPTELNAITDETSSLFAGARTISLVGSSYGIIACALLIFITAHCIALLLLPRYQPPLQ